MWGDGGNTSTLTICIPSVPTFPPHTMKLCLKHEHFQHLDVISTHLAVYISNHKPTLQQTSTMTHTQSIQPILGSPGLLYTPWTDFTCTPSPRCSNSLTGSNQCMRHSYVLSQQILSLEGRSHQELIPPMQYTRCRQITTQLNHCSIQHKHQGPLVTYYLITPPTLDMQTRFLLAATKSGSVPHTLR